MKAIMISIKPKWVAEILNGKKTLEIRKKFPKNYRGWVYIYCTKGKPYLYKDYDENVTGDKVFTDIEKPLPNEEQYLGGKVVTRFYCDNVDMVNNYYLEEICALSCLEDDELLKYAGGTYDKVDDLYAIHISQLEIFDKPNELSEFKHWKKEYNPYGEVRDYYGEIYSYCLLPLTKAPQNFCYVEVVKTKNVDKK